MSRLLREVALLSAFVMLGTLVLVFSWLSFQFQNHIVDDYRLNQVSLTLADNGLVKFEKWARHNQNIDRYEILTGEVNKRKLQELYPELKELVKDIETQYFPVTATVSVKNLDEFMASLSKMDAVIGKQIIHEPPQKFQGLLWSMSGLLVALWTLTMFLVLYFQWESVARQQERAWSLLKMLGEKPFQIFIPLWKNQSIRVALSSLAAVAASTWIIQLLVQQMSWTGLSMSWQLAAGFVVLSVLASFIVSLILFSGRYQKVLIG